jgi:MFS family permease
MERAVEGERMNSDTTKLQVTIERSGQRNILILTICQGLFICAISVDLTLTGLTGYELAPTKILATLPFALITVVGAAVTLSASLLMQRFGRRLGFSLGASIGACGGVISVWAVFHAHFWAFCLGTSAVGAFQAFAQYYRLAAADCVVFAGKSRAISTVLTGGVIAAVLGPALAARSKGLFPTALFAGSYLLVAVLCLISVVMLLAFYQDTKPSPVETQTIQPLPSRPLAAIICQPVFMASLANNVVGSVVMMFIMTAAPLAAVACHHSIDDGANIIQWHLVGMFAPSLFAGYLIKRFGVSRVVFVGMFLNVLCAIISMTSNSLISFYFALLSLGIGWNFMFVGGTLLLTESYRPAEKGKTQGVAEFFRYAATALATLAAGPLLEYYGWSRLNLWVLPILSLCAILTLWWVMTARRRPQNAGNLGI